MGIADFAPAARRCPKYANARDVRGYALWMLCFLRVIMVIADKRSLNSIDVMVET